MGEKNAGRDVRTIGIANVHDPVWKQLVQLGGSADESYQAFGLDLQILLVEDAFSQPAKAPRYSVLQDSPARAQ